jgi:NTE family protein
MSSPKNSIGLVLGGGGVRGFFHIGVIKAIQQQGITINKISGTSIGAVVGAMYAANPAIDLEKLASELDYFTMIKTMAFGTKNSSARGIEPLLRTYIPVNNFSQLKIPLSFNATDINHRQEIVFQEGSIYPGLLAAISIPGVFPPVKVGHKFLVDGGVINNVPISLINDTEKLIVSDITGPIKKIDNHTLALDVLYSSIAFMQSHAGQAEIGKITRQKIIYLNLDDDTTFILDFRQKNYRALIDLGYQSMMKSNSS